MTRPDRPSTTRRARLAAAVLAAGLATTPTAGCGDDRDDHRRAAVASRGQSVMPFDLDRTTHRFTRTGTGGEQTVVADDPTDTVQVGLVQRHLREEAARFARGDFTDPARIHGDHMPGLAELRAGGGRIAIAYEPVSAGGRITYTTTEPALVAALHAWFDAQVSDHGRHAERG
jgi:hypothetical protein